MLPSFSRRGLSFRNRARPWSIADILAHYGPMVPDTFNPLSATLPNLDDMGLRNCTKETIEEAFTKIKVQLDAVDLTHSLREDGQYALYGPIGRPIVTHQERKLCSNIHEISQMFRNWMDEAINFSGLANTHPGQTHQISDVVIAKTQCIIDQLAKIKTECAGKTTNYFDYVIHVRNTSRPGFVRDGRDGDPMYQNFLNAAPVIEFYDNCKDLLTLADDWMKEILVFQKHLNLRRSTRVKKPVTKYQAGGTK